MDEETNMVIDNTPVLKDNCYTFTIRHLSLFKEAVDNFYQDKDGSADNNPVWRNRNDGKTQLLTFTDDLNNIKVTTTFYWTTGTVCSQGSKRSLNAWIQDHCIHAFKERLDP